ncbi:hypothetical protein [Devosia sp.]|nr:hypothetical protein [Devosia sp.]MCR6636428.1 hypothetical protein [Devosia sp.]
MEESIWEAGTFVAVVIAILWFMLMVGIHLPLTEIDMLPVGL